MSNVAAKVLPMDDKAAAFEVCYSEEYNHLLSSVAQELSSEFAALASPTLSKQETVSLLYQRICAGLDNGSSTPRFPWRHLLEFLPRILFMFFRVSYAALRYRVKHLPEGAVIFRTWLVPRSFKGTALSDDYFRELADDLTESESVVTSFTTIDMGLLRKFGEVRHNGNQIISYGLLSIVDVIKLFFDYVITGLVQTRKCYSLNGRDVTAHINHSLLLDYLMLHSFEAYAEKYKCQKLAEHRVKAFIYVFENQSWEKVCCDRLREHGIHLIGYQSSGFSPVFLNFFPTEEDANQHPMPDILLTVGDYFRQYLLEYGHYSVPIETFAALRFSYPTEDGRYVVLSPNADVVGRILYAFPVQKEQYVATINDLVEVFGDGEIEVDLKLHPLYQLSDLKGIADLPNNFKIVSDVAMDALRETYDCLLFNDNSFGIEALMKGVKSYQYNRNGQFSDDRFMYFDLWQVNYQFSDLQALKSSIQNGTYMKAFDVDKVADYINGMYCAYNVGAKDRLQKLLNRSHSAA